MLVMKKISTFLSFMLLGVLFINSAFSQKVFRTLGSGIYNVATTWELSTTGPSGTFTPATGTSSGTAFPNQTSDVIIQTGHTVTLAATQTVKNLTINTGGALISDGTA